MRAPQQLTIGAVVYFAVFVVALVDGVLVAAYLLRLLDWT